MGKTLTKALHKLAGRTIALRRKLRAERREYRHDLDRMTEEIADHRQSADRASKAAAELVSLRKAILAELGEADSPDSTPKLLSRMIGEASLARTDERGRDADVAVQTIAEANAILKTPPLGRLQLQAKSVMTLVANQRSIIDRIRQILGTGTTEGLTDACRRVMREHAETRARLEQQLADAIAKVVAANRERDASLKQLAEIVDTPPAKPRIELPWEFCRYGLIADCGHGSYGVDHGETKYYSAYWGSEVADASRRQIASHVSLCDAIRICEEHAAAQSAAAQPANPADPSVYVY